MKNHPSCANRKELHKATRIPVHKAAKAFHSFVLSIFEYGARDVTVRTHEVVGDAFNENSIFLSCILK